MAQVTALLADAVQYARKRAQTITWTDKDGLPINLTNATLRARKADSDGAQTAVTGALSVTSGAAGQFTWAYSDEDVAEAGDYLVQFSAAKGDGLLEISYQTRWRVLPSLDFELVSPSLSPSASASASA